MDTFGLTQGFSGRLSILGADIWAIVLDRLKRGGMPAGPEGYLLNLHGRQYFQLHNMMKGLGKRALDLFNTYDNALEGREAELLRDYKAETMSPQMKDARRAQISMVGKMLPHTIRLLWDPVRFAKGTEDSVEGLLAKFRAMEERPAIRRACRGCLQGVRRHLLRLPGIYGRVSRRMAHPADDARHRGRGAEDVSGDGRAVEPHQRDGSRDAGPRTVARHPRHTGCRRIRGTDHGAVLFARVHGGVRRLYRQVWRAGVSRNRRRNAAGDGTSRRFLPATQGDQCR